MCEVSPENMAASESPFCDWELKLENEFEHPTMVLVPALQFQKHVGQHLEQLALFTVPTPLLDASPGLSSKGAVPSHEAGSDPEDIVSGIAPKSETSQDGEPSMRLYQAVINCDIKAVKESLHNGAHANIISPHW